MLTIASKIAIVRRVAAWRAASRRRRRLSEVYRREIADHRPITDVFVVSYPKSGRTWHRMLLGGYLAAAEGLPPRQAADVEALTAPHAGRRIRYTHNAANFVDALDPDHPLVASPALWQGRKVIFIVREPKDVLVSAWFHARERSGIDDRPLADFIRDRRVGAPKLAAAMTRWWNNREQASACLITSYEALAADAHAELRRTLEFVGWPVDPVRLEQAVASASFERMRAAETRGAIAHASMRTPTARPLGRKVRAGKVGGYVAHMSAWDVAYVDAQMGDSGYPQFQAAADRAASAGG